MPAFTNFKDACQAELSTILPKRIAAVDWDMGTLEAHRAEAFTNLLSHTDSHSPWHHKRFKSIELSSLSPDNITALPTMKKSDLIVSFDNISTDPKVTRAWCESNLAAGQFYTDGSYCILASGGSSGHRSMQVYTPKNAAEFLSAVLRQGARYTSRQQVNNEPPVIQAWIAAAVGAAHATSVLPPVMGLTDDNLFAVTEPITEISEKLNALQPTHLMVYSSYLRHLIQAREDGLLDISPRNISLTSETPNPVDIAHARKIWGCNITSTWASIEFGAMGISSGFEEGHLLSDDMLIIEAVDEDNKPVLPGEKVTKLLITNLYNTTVPLIRYELTDQLTIFNRPPICGSNFRAASLVDGRLDDHFVYDGNIRVHSHLFRHVLEQRPGILEYQIRQTTDGADLALIIAGNAKVRPQQITQLLERDLEKMGVAGAKIRVDIVPSIQRTAAQKLTRFIPL